MKLGRSEWVLVLERLLVCCTRTRNAERCHGMLSATQYIGLDPLVQLPAAMPLRAHLLVFKLTHWNAPGCHQQRPSKHTLEDLSHSHTKPCVFSDSVISTVNFTYNTLTIDAISRKTISITLIDEVLPLEMADYFIFSHTLNAGPPNNMAGDHPPSARRINSGVPGGFVVPPAMYLGLVLRLGVTPLPESQLSAREGVVAAESDDLRRNSSISFDKLLFKNQWASSTDIKQEKLGKQRYYVEPEASPPQWHPLSANIALFCSCANHFPCGQGYLPRLASLSKEPDNQSLSVASNQDQITHIEGKKRKADKGQEN
ncbi:uncharacterized protein CLUP02_01194 [Colletotrichum lupini]|uniref:Uncharacterized protein n=1 Tax=Colletotrichum lupini TaxID=145971 RepID=A0A9Q8W8F6_9PEZI|nr:uncharacterized protein CLUP02_01194 [Colletotrichum lupini]UQC74543.1 hypothetical protein CLUP02_01194 [Colletotrichum lupini]